MSSKRKLACEFNLVGLRGQAERLFMWTFTFPVFTEPEQAREPVRQLIQRLNRLGCTGVRVYERHKRSKGLHVHVVLDRYLFVREMREWCRGHGFGRIHVKILHRSDAGTYIAKELNKNSQAVNSRGCRVYAAFGRGWKTVGKSLIKNITFDTTLSRSFRFLLGAGCSFAQARQINAFANVAGVEPIGFNFSFGLTGEQYQESECESYAK